jgi:hypothetical protein
MTEVEQIPLEPVDALSVTVLVDNVVDMLLVDDGPARHPVIGSEPRVPAPVLDLWAKRSTRCAPNAASRRW